MSYFNETIDDNPSLNTKEYQQFREEYEAWLDERAKEEGERNDQQTQRQLQVLQTIRFISACEVPRL